MIFTQHRNILHKSLIGHQILVEYLNTTLLQLRPCLRPFSFPLLWYLLLAARLGDVTVAIETTPRGAYPAVETQAPRGPRRGQNPPVNNTFWRSSNLDASFWHTSKIWRCTRLPSTSSGVRDLSKWLIFFSFIQESQLNMLLQREQATPKDTAHIQFFQHHQSNFTHSPQDCNWTFVALCSLLSNSVCVCEIVDTVECHSKSKASVWPRMSAFRPVKHFLAPNIWLQEGSVQQWEFVCEFVDVRDLEC